jgi:hypothetical protein
MQQRSLGPHPDLNVTMRSWLVRGEERSGGGDAAAVAGRGSGGGTVVQELQRLQIDAGELVCMLMRIVLHMQACYNHPAQPADLD